ncbi:exo-alpha-sialidase [Aquabacterium sp.]|uniref:exo-alpha-sialidase n=1 Tax=Aquabacterium sp. TaxID=1872578 RepID=UPI002E3532A9|nr:exo-alpha-sialidase [Aquabacterium sp.]HEX5312279.1 exo-alpha-sialidase [Aquabacterium sp.]
MRTLIQAGLYSFAGLAFALLAGPAWADAPAGGMHAQHARPQLGSSAIFSPTGQLLVAAKDGDHVVLYRSADEGQTWAEPIKVNTQAEAISADGQNRPKIALATDGSALISWTQPLPKPYTGAVRMARAADGEHFAAPFTVHSDKAEITHRFESMLALPGNKVVVAWIDKREAEAAKARRSAYRGAGIYAALSSDGGQTFGREYKLADHSCECCRLASAVDRDGSALFLWRHVFEPNERDHALAKLGADGQLRTLQRATFDGWKLDGCPHHGPGLTVDQRGVKHAVWFNQKDGQANVFYGRLVDAGKALRVEGQRAVGGARAAHADVLAAGNKLAVIWTEFNGEATRLLGMVSTDGGRNFGATVELDTSAGAVSTPSLIAKGDALFAFWRTEREGFRVRPLP